MERHRPAVLLTAFFLAANVLGVSAGLRLYGSAAVQDASAAYQAPASGLGFFAVLVLATVLLLALYRFQKEVLVKLWLGAAVLFTSMIFFNAFAPLIPAAALAVTLLVIRSTTDRMLLRNALDTVPFAGTGALFGTLLGFQAVLVFAALLAVYDYVAVNRLGHMVTLAEAGTASGTFMGFQYPKEGGPAVSREEGVSGRSGGEGTAQVGMLGGGDVVLPIMFAVAVIPFFGVGAAVSSVAGSAAALYAFLTVVQEKETERFYPAIPVVGSGAVFGLVLFLLVSAL